MLNCAREGTLTPLLVQSSLGWRGLQILLVQVLCWVQDIEAIQMICLSLLGGHLEQGWLGRLDVYSWNASSQASVSRSCQAYIMFTRSFYKPVWSHFMPCFRYDTTLADACIALAQRWIKVRLGTSHGSGFVFLVFRVKPHPPSFRPKTRTWAPLKTLM